MSPLTYSLPKASVAQKKMASFAIAAVFHVFLLTLGSVVFAQTAQYGIETGTGGIEIHMIAALPQAQEMIDIPVETPETVVQESEQMNMPEVKEEAKVEIKNEDKITGDGSSLIPGKDVTTLHTAAGAETLAKPNYLKNPAPQYPLIARQNKQEGLVLLFVEVNEKGLAKKVALKKSSGYSSLDEAAQKAVSRWKFLPAKVGSMPVESRVEVPVRFELNQVNS